MNNEDILKTVDYILDKHLRPLEELTEDQREFVETVLLSQVEEWRIRADEYNDKYDRAMIKDYNDRHGRGKPGESK